MTAADRRRAKTTAELGCVGCGHGDSHHRYGRCEGSADCDCTRGVDDGDWRGSPHPRAETTAATVADETPDTDTVRFWYAQPTGGGEALPHLEAEFDRWLAQERAEAGARALDEASLTTVCADDHLYLWKRAARLRGREGK